MTWSLRPPMGFPQAGTRRRRAEPRSLVVVVAGTLSILVVATGCGISAEDAARPVDAVVATGPEAGETPAASRSTFVWMVKGNDLVRTLRTVPRSPSVNDLLAVLLAGPTATESKRRITSRLVAGSVSAGQQDTTPTPGAERTGEVIISDALRSEQTDEQVLALGQVVLTVTSGGYAAVNFVGEDGEAVAVPAPNGAILTGPVTAKDYSSLQLRR